MLRFIAQTNAIIEREYPFSWEIYVAIFIFCILKFSFIPWRKLALSPVIYNTFMGWINNSREQASNSASCLVPWLVAPRRTVLLYSRLSRSLSPFSSAFILYYHHSRKTSHRFLKIKKHTEVTNKHGKSSNLNSSIWTMLKT